MTCSSCQNSSRLESTIVRVSVLFYLDIFPALLLFLWPSEDFGKGVFLAVRAGTFSVFSGGATVLVQQVLLACDVRDSAGSLSRRWWRAVLLAGVVERAHGVGRGEAGRVDLSETGTFLHAKGLFLQQKVVGGGSTIRSVLLTVEWSWGAALGVSAMRHGEGGIRFRPVQVPRWWDNERRGFQNLPI